MLTSIKMLCTIVLLAFAGLAHSISADELEDIISADAWTYAEIVDPIDDSIIHNAQIAGQTTRLHEPQIFISCVPEKKRM